MGYEGEAEEKSMRLVNKIKDGIETLKPDNPALKTAKELYARAASMELREHAAQATYEREQLKQRLVLYNRERKESPVMKEKMSLEEMETILMSLEGSVPLEEERTKRGRGKVLISYQPLNEYTMVRDGVTVEVDTLLMDREDWEELTRGGGHRRGRKNRSKREGTEPEGRGNRLGEDLILWRKHIPNGRRRKEK